MKKTIIIFSFFLLILSSCFNRVDILDLAHLKTSELSVTSYSPGGESIDVPINAKITIAFSSEMDTDSVKNAFRLKYANQTIREYDGNFSFSPDNRAFLFIPFYEFPPDTIVTVTIDDSARDINDFTLLDGFEFQFTTSSNTTPDTISPTLDNHDPLDSDVVTIDSYIELTFSEPMLKSTVEYALLLTADGDIRTRDDGVFEWYDNDKKVRYTPDDPLSIGAEYTLS